MHGFIHLLLEGFVSETVGPQHLRPIRRMAGLDGPPLATQYYPDEMTTRLLQAISEYEGVALDDLLYQFGVYFMCAPLMHQHYRAFLDGHTSARSFLEQISAIHRHLSQSLKGAMLPQFRYVNHGPELLEIVYNSPRRLCRFLQGVIHGVGQYFNEPLEIREMECQHRGASACRLLVRFLPASRPGPLSEHPSSAAAGAGASGPQDIASAPPHPFAGAKAATAESEAKRQREEDEDLLILQILSIRRAASHPLQPDSASDPPLNMALSLFEIVQWLTAKGVPAEFTRLSLIQRSLTRLAVQGFVEVKLDPHATRQSASPGAALSGQGILAAQRYRITQSGL
ncbi:MAG TPA: heme NO-binding domain-containing protein, partial [Ktedonobacterales bacterium]|nr:heme NO-binding domain-containing protein [Ktedonobacterales bacterium]